MAHRITRFRLVLVSADIEESFEEDEKPSLPGVPVYDATGEDITHVTRAAGLRKCPAAALPERRRKGGVR